MRTIIKFLVSMVSFMLGFTVFSFLTGWIITTLGPLMAFFAFKGILTVALTILMVWAIVNWFKERRKDKNSSQ